MLSFSKEVMEDAEARTWIEEHKSELGLFDIFDEGIKGLIGYSFEALRDEELSKKYQEDEDWN